MTTTTTQSHRRIMHLRCSTWAIGTVIPALHGGSFSNDVAAIGALGDLRMKSQLGTSKARNDYADWQCRLAAWDGAHHSRAGRHWAAVDHSSFRGYAPLAHHGAGACDVCLPCADTVC